MGKGTWLTALSLPGATPIPIGRSGQVPQTQRKTFLFLGHFRGPPLQNFNLKWMFCSLDR